MTQTRRQNIIFSYALLTLILLGGAYLRFHNIGKFSFWTDEFYHVFAAKSLNANGSLFVPYWGEHNLRVIPTYITAFMFKFFGESEAFARTPFAAINLSFILIGYFFIRRMFNDAIAIIFALFAAFSPFTILMARECRNYTAFQLMFFIMSVSFFAGFEHYSDKWKIKWPQLITSFEIKHNINFMLLAISLVAGLVSVTLQLLTFTIVFVIIAYSAILFLNDVTKKGLKDSLYSKYTLSLFFLLLSATLICVFKFEYLQKMYRLATEVPEWATYKATDFSYYRWFLADRYPALFYLYPLGAFFMIHKYGKKGLFFVLLFVIPLFIHSFLYARKTDRYIFYILPYFPLAAAALIEPLAPHIKSIAENIQPQRKWTKYFLIVLALPALLFFLQPWASQARFVTQSSKFPDWKTFSPELKEKITRGTVLTTRGMEYQYYFKQKPDYLVQKTKRKNYTYDEGLIMTYEDLRQTIETNSDLYLVIHKSHLNNKAYFDDKMRNYLLALMTEIKAGHDPAISVFFKK